MKKLFFKTLLRYIIILYSIRFFLKFFKTGSFEEGFEVAMDGSFEVILASLIFTYYLLYIKKKP